MCESSPPIKRCLYFAHFGFCSEWNLCNPEVGGVCGRPGSVRLAEMDGVTCAKDKTVRKGFFFSNNKLWKIKTPTLMWEWLKLTLLLCSNGRRDSLFLCHTGVVFVRVLMIMSTLSRKQSSSQQHSVLWRVCTTSSPVQLSLLTN